MTCQLIRINIEWDTNEYGERACMVTPIYRRDGKIMSVPDTKGWPTRAEAIADAERIAGGKLEPIV
jgi:hypothetical protein